jgi:proline iminopeptidase
MIDVLTNASVATGSVEVAGARLTYRAEGSGIPCLVFGGAIYYPRTFSPHLREHLRLIFVDPRHFAPSPSTTPVAQVTIATYADDIETVRRALGLGRILVLGHSIHGTLVLEYARRYPESVSGVIALAAPCFWGPDYDQATLEFWQRDASAARKAALEAALATLPAAVLRTLDPGEAFIRQYVTNGPKYWRDPQYDCTWLWEGVAVDVPLLVHLFWTLFWPYDLAQAPGTITAPVFLGLGRYDYVVPSTSWEGRTGALPHLTSHLFTHSGHTPQLEEPEAFDRALLAWVRQVTAPST